MPRVVVLGASVDGLVAAHLLARSGLEVVVVETDGAREGLDVGWVPPLVARDLALDRHGLRTIEPDPWIAAPLESGGRLELWRDMARTVDAIRRVSPSDAHKWPAFSTRMRRLGRLLESLYVARAPDFLSSAPSDLLQLARIGWRVRWMGKEGTIDLLRTLPMSVAELLDDWFESDVLKGALGAGGIMHLGQGPMAGGTAFLMLHHHVGCPAGVFRPPHSNIGHVLDELPGVERRAAHVKSIAIEGGSVHRVVLDDGEELEASTIVSALDPRRTLLELLDPVWLDPDLVRALKHVRARGVSARVTFTVDRAPGFTSLARAPSLDYIERASEDAKYGRISAEPYLEARVEEGSNGAHTVYTHVQYAPYALRDGAWGDAERGQLADAATASLERHHPGFGQTVVAREVMAPIDLERAFGWPEGQPYHAELALDQVLSMRPVPALARYRTPISGLYLCGPAMHPGGGVLGAAGRNAARAVLRDRRR